MSKNKTSVKVKNKLLENSTLFYIDTSAINRLATMLNPQDAFATRKLLKARKKLWCMSTVNLQEIFATKNEIRREIIICRMSQFYPKPTAFIDSPTRILFHDLLNYKSSLTNTEKSIKEAWFDICKDSRKTFILEYEKFYKRDNIKKILQEEIKKIIKTSRNDNEAITQVKSFLVAVIFCSGITDLDNSFTEIFWKTKNVDLIADRFDYIKKYHSKVFKSEQINLITEFILWHSKRSKGVDRGLFYDAFSLIYCWPCLFYITYDKDIYDFSQINLFLKDRILYMSEENIERI